MRYASLGDLNDLIRYRIPEAPSLEFKRDLHLDSRTQRLEALKDLTAMANGGGGSILFGVDEEDGDWPTATQLSPLSDRGIVSRLENIVRDGVRPPLLMQWVVIQVDSGFVLSVDVEPSALGPYMIQAYGEFRHHRRFGQRTEPMTEQQVRDAYALSFRAREHRQDLWDAHALPVQPASEHPWLSVSALPEEPLLEILDVAEVDPETLRPPTVIKQYLDYFGLGGALERLGRWADGLFGYDGNTPGQPHSASVRLHTDGSAAVSRQLRLQLSPISTARVLNAELSYLSWFWQNMGAVRPVELVVHLDQLTGCTLNVGGIFDEERIVNEPPGVPIHSVTLRRHITPWEIAMARGRHRVVRAFADRLFQAFGLSRAVPMFRSGQLYREGGPVGLSYVGRGVFGGDGRPLAYVYDDGTIRSAVTSRLTAFLVDGVVLDLHGDTLAVVEMACGEGVPDDFFPGRLAEDPRARVVGGDAGDPDPAPESVAPPAPSGRWSLETDLAPYFRSIP